MFRRNEDKTFTVISDGKEVATTTNIRSAETTDKSFMAEKEMSQGVRRGSNTILDEHISE